MQLARLFLVFASAALARTVLVSALVQLRGESRHLTRSGGTAIGERRPLWTFWVDEVQPDLVRLCLKSWERHAGQGWQLRVVTRSTVRNYVGAADLPEQFDHLEPSFQADALRLALLRRYGGAWVDATTIATQDLSDWIDTEFIAGRSFVGFFIDHYTSPGGLPVIASWAMAIPSAEMRLMAEWHAAYIRLWGNRTTSEGITDDPFFHGADFARVNPLQWDYLHIELALLTLMQRDTSLRAEFERKSTLWRAEDTAYGLQASLGLGWMTNSRCAPVTTPLAALPEGVQSALNATPLVKLRHEDRRWLIHMPSSLLLGSGESVIGALLTRNAGPSDGTAVGEDQDGSITCDGVDNNS